MLAILIIILVLLGAAVVGSIYSNFLVFHSNFSESENYHKAYYASISALERGELVTKQRQPGYEGSGGFILGTGQGSIADGGSDKNLSGFSYFSGNNDEISVFRTISSRTTRIPKEGKGDVEWMLSAEDSNNYNTMDYENAEIFLLYYDESSGNPYSTGSTGGSSRSQIMGKIRLPKLLSGFGPLDVHTSSAGAPGSLPTNDAIVDRQIRGNYYSAPFTIFSTSNFTVGGGAPQINEERDSVIRENDINPDNINDGLNFNFGNNRRSPLPSPRGNGAELTIISQNENNIKNNVRSFGDIFSTDGAQLRFSLLNLLLGTGQKIYPFLEYYVDFGGASVPDKYFTINGEGNYKDYQVNTIIQKPTVKESILGNFTSIF